MPQSYGFSEQELDRPIAAPTECHKAVGSLRDLVAHLQRTYCGSVGVEYLHIDDVEVRNWLCDRMERSENRLESTPAEQIRIFTRLTEAVVFEEFLHKKYTGAKTFSLEGAEILIALLDAAIEQSAREGVDEIVLGMAHRGRLNVLANILHKSPRQVFSEFEDRDPEVHGGGDVKYHLGHSNTWTAANGRRIRLTLCFNPSHLEFVDPVAEGVMRAKLDRRAVPPERGLPILIHGDAAFAGEGVVQETLNLSRLPHYAVGGTIHVIVNNQIGFTTPPAEGRSTRYASDVAKMLPSPILHVNGEDPEAVAWVVALALDFRRQFQRDVVLDVYCYRRHGHNESDEPAFTQPLVYRRIESRPSVREAFAANLISRGVLNRPQAERAVKTAWARLEEEFDKTRQGDLVGPSCVLDDVWKGYRGGREIVEPCVDTAVARSRLSAMLERLSRTPEDFHLHPKLQRILDHRRQMAQGQRPVDWAAAEALALGTLAVDGYRVRLSGQDTARGTFSQRHAALHDVRRRPYPHAAGPPRPGPGPGGDLQQPLVGSGNPGLRVRLQPRLPRLLRGLGGPVRRLPQRRPGDRRPVPGQRGREVVAAQRHRTLAAARLRGTGAGAFRRPAGAVLEPGHGRQLPGRPAHHAGAILPRPPPANAPPLAETAAGAHAQEPPAASAGGLRP